MPSSATRKETEEELLKLVAACNAKERYVLFHAAAQLTMLKEDGAFGAVTVHTVGGDLRRAVLEQSVQP